MSVVMSEDKLTLKARKLWPWSERMRREWLRAVMVVRSTARGWILDRKTPRLEAPNEQ